MQSQKSDIEAASEYICVQLHPPDLRADYVRDIRLPCLSEAIVYLMHVLSLGMTSLFVGLVANYLYDKTKKPDQGLVDLEALLRKQQNSLDQLEALIAKCEEPNFRDYANRRLEFHRKILVQVQDSDPALAAMVDDVLHQLDRRGERAVTDEVDSYYR